MRNGIVSFCFYFAKRIIIKSRCHKKRKTLTKILRIIIKKKYDF